MHMQYVKISAKFPFKASGFGDSVGVVSIL